MRNDIHVNDIIIIIYACILKRTCARAACRRTGTHARIRARYYYYYNKKKRDDGNASAMRDVSQTESEGEKKK